MELLHWPSEKKWFLPSIDIESLELLVSLFLIYDLVNNMLFIYRKSKQ